ncbi:MAG TPA: glycosyltransferase [Ideonella sp.]|nr:glycosyltransferase [Ideonella sp.]
MKVLQLSKFYPPERGGMESAVHELVGGLNGAGWATDVLCAHRDWRTVCEQHDAGYRVVRAGSLGTLMSTSVSPALLAQVCLLASDYRLIHVHMPNPAAAMALWLARPRGRVVVHWHSDVVRQQRALKLYESLQCWLLHRADLIVATSQPYAQASKALAPWQKKVAVVPLGIGDNARRVDARRVAQLRAAYPDKKMVFSLGRMVAYKGFDVLIDAAALLPDDTVVVVGGGGPLLETHRAQVAARGLQAKVHLAGPIAEDDLPNYHHAADLFCMPSTTRAEAFGVAMLEAMAAGRPVVCSDIAGSALPWVNQHGVTGYTVHPGAPRPLAEAIKHALADTDQLHRLGAAARERYLQHFTASTMIERFTAMYRQLLAA